MTFRLRLNPSIVPILFLAGTLHARPGDTRILLLDDFEGYTNTTAMRTIWAGGNAVLDTHAPGGGHAASHDGGNMTGYNGIAAWPDATHNVLFSADLYDPGTNDDKRVTIILKNGSGDSVEFGFVQKSAPYALRVTGFATQTDWIPFDPAFRSARGWHRFQAIISLTNTLATLDLNRDGELDMALVFDGPPPAKPFKSIRFGGLADRTSPGGPVLIDNVELALIPPGGPMPAIAMHPPTIVPLPPDNTPRRSPEPVVPSSAAVIPEEPRQSMVLWWIVAALAVIIGLLSALLLTLRRSARTGASAWALATVTPPGPIVGPLDGNPAVTAELADFAKQSLVQGLYSQRLALVEAQQRAQHDLTELEARLNSLQLPLQERIHAYEKKIADLEKQLDARGEEMKELTQVTLRLMREKLEEEREREKLGGSRFN